MSEVLDDFKKQGQSARVESVVVGTLNQVVTKLKELHPIESPMTPTSRYFYLPGKEGSTEEYTFEQQIADLPVIVLPSGRMRYGAVFFMKRDKDNISFKSARVEVHSED